MRAEKQFLSQEYLGRLRDSPFFLLVHYRGLKVSQFSELRNRLRGVGAEMHVVKNSVFRIAAKEAGVADLTGALTGQMAAVTGQQDISATAKIVKNFHAEFDKPKLQLAYLGNERLDEAQLNTLADLPSLDVLRGMLLGVFEAPATKLVRLLHTPATQLARVLQARSDQQKES